MRAAMRSKSFHSLLHAASECTIRECIQYLSLVLRSREEEAARGKEEDLQDRRLANLIGIYCLSVQRMRIRAEEAQSRASR